MSNNNQTLSKVQELHYTYVTVKESFKNEETEYASYGISVLDGDKEISRVSDISTDFEEVSKLATLCTEQELAPEHLGDVIEDFLAEGSLSLT